jgi:glutamate synthase (NADPH/NADH) small chain
MEHNNRRIPANKRAPSQRRADFDEVSRGYDVKQALAEAKRCLFCKNKPCVEGCPVSIDIPAFIQAIINGDIKEAYAVIQDSNSLPGICGRVCPQEDQCAKVCTLGKKFEPVNIGVLERYVADEARKRNLIAAVNKTDPAKPSIGVVGAGPAGLTIAGDMARRGFPAVIYESLHEPGGVLRYGIPEFRLPNHVIDSEVSMLKQMGVAIRTNHVIGKILTLDELLEMHAAVFIGTGAGLPRFMGIPGENLNGVYSANEYLTRSNLMESYRYPLYHTPLKVGKTVAVVGGGNVAMDSARTAVRLGAKKVYNIYRRSRQEMPARDEEIENAIDEGVDLNLLINPVEISGDENYRVRKIKCVKMRLGEPDESGRKRPVEIPGSEFEMDVDVVVMAIGTGPNRVLLEATPRLSLNKWGYIEIDGETGKTSIDRMYAGGDIVTGSATVISAMGAARKAGKEMRKIL